MRPACHFLDEYCVDGRYQMCSCGKHLWSTVSHRVIMKKPNRRTFLTSAGKEKVLWDDEVSCEGGGMSLADDDDEMMRTAEYVDLARRGGFITLNRITILAKLLVLFAVCAVTGLLGFDGELLGDKRYSYLRRSICFFASSIPMVRNSWLNVWLADVGAPKSYPNSSAAVEMFGFAVKR